MARLGIPAPRISVALTAVLAAFAAAAIAVPGIARAADHSVSLSCTPATIDPGKATKCLAIVTSNNSSVPAPSGEVGFSVTGFTGYLDLGERSCDLVPLGVNAASCSLSVTGYVKGEENVLARYPAEGPIPDEGGAGLSEITIRGGSMRVFCEDPVVVVDEATECQAYIPTAPGAAPATGSVAFSQVNRWYGAYSGEVEPECVLEPFAEGAACSVTYVPYEGEYAVLGEYGGDGTYPADSGTGFTTAVRIQTSVETSCDRQQPLISTLIECTMTVARTWPPGGAAPTGGVAFDRESPGAGSFPGTQFPHQGFCNLEPVAVRQSACSVVYRPEALGLQALKGSFFGGDQYEPGDDSFDLEVKKGLLTATNLTCEAGKVGVFRKCTATVRDAEGNPAISPVGSVSFSGNATFSSNLCKLAPSSAEAGVTRCEVTYKPSAVGSLVLRADYEDSGSTHRPSKAETSVQVQPPF